ncbi:hypothetical protein LZK98_16330 [Sphingomonas cannabina]|uniref:hypothetical protein n=1 Tax=Sphingomonas cannabina TaxID=2899123 RepID=UPI001F455B33|nr:hypothetical protein [Sphingomonas cannabina]UIJ44611.1 hypothetical protein LZK98_16330 [Sphingomonas cannabina]
MAYDAAYYRGQAARARAEADAATLANVRDRAMRSVAAFEAMAAKVERVARSRAEREASGGTDLRPSFTREREG